MGADAVPTVGRGLGRALRNTGWLLAGRGVGAVLSLFYLALVTRGLGPEGFGRFVIVIGIGQAVAAVASIQTWQAVVHYGAGYLKTGVAGRLRDLATFCGLLELGCAAIGVVLGTLAIWALAPRLGWDAATAGYAMAFTAILLLSVRSTPIGLLRLHDMYRLGALADAATPMLRMIGAAALYVSRPTLEGFLLIWAMSELVTAILYWILARVAAPGSLTRPVKATLRSPRQNPGFWHFLAGANASAIFGSAGKPMAVVVVGMFVGTTAAGSYRLASQLGQSLARIADLLARGFFGEFALARSALGQDGARRLFRQSVVLASTLGAIIAILALTIGAPMLTLVAGPQYAAAYPLLLIFALAAVFDVAGFGFEPALLSAGDARRVLWARIGVLVVMAGGMVILLPAFGAKGAAFAMLATSMSSYVLQAVLVWRANARLRTKTR